MLTVCMHACAGQGCYAVMCGAVHRIWVWDLLDWIARMGSTWGFMCLDVVTGRVALVCEGFQAWKGMYWFDLRLLAVIIIWKLPLYITETL